MIRYVFFIVFLLLSSLAQAQQASPHGLDVQHYYGTLLRHNTNVAHLVTDHPVGIIASYNHKTFGEKHWQQAYNYPDWGISFIYQDFRNEILGENYGFYGHYNFYFLNRNIMLRIGQGVSYNTNPFDIDTNFKNSAYGSRILASTYLLLNYKKERLFKGFGIQGGLSFLHYSNGSFRAPNSGTNIFAINLGINYDFDSEVTPVYELNEEQKGFSEKIKYNFLFRAGVNEGDIVGLGQHPFLVLTAFADKRLNYKSTIQFGTEVFFSRFLKEEIDYLSTAFASSPLTGDEDYKRVGIFLGHEFRLGKFAIPTQLGYYVYWPYEYENRVYTRIGVKYYATEKIFAVATVKTHAANAEAIEFGFGIRI